VGIGFGADPWRRRRDGRISKPDMEERSMRVRVDVADDDLKVLTQLAERRGVSRAVVMREALRLHAERHRTIDLGAAFGLWNTGEDGLAYQERMRAEW